MEVSQMRGGMSGEHPILLRLPPGMRLSCNLRILKASLARCTPLWHSPLRTMPSAGPSSAVWSVTVQYPTCRNSRQHWGILFPSSPKQKVLSYSSIPQGMPWNSSANGTSLGRNHGTMLMFLSICCHTGSVTCGPNSQQAILSLPHG